MTRPIPKVGDVVEVLQDGAWAAVTLVAVDALRDEDDDGPREFYPGLGGVRSPLRYGSRGMEWRWPAEAP